LRHYPDDRRELPEMPWEVPQAAAEVPELPRRPPWTRLQTTVCS
jgi:hypothetical protein